MTLTMTLLSILAWTGIVEYHGEGPIDLTPVPLETPSFQYQLFETAHETVTLELIETRENRVTDLEEWFAYIVWPAVTYHNGGVNDEIRGTSLPYDIAELLRTPGEGLFHLFQVIYGEESTIATYGSAPNRFDVILDPRILVVMDKETRRPGLVLDFLTYSNAPETLPGDEDFVFQQIRWAVVQEGILYVSTAHRTYAESSGGLNAYITALDMNTLEVLWRSEPLVSNSENFLIAGDTIISGYGFTAEDDYIYLLDRLTGEVTGSYGVPSAPDYLYRDGNMLYVRCYNADCVFRIV